MRSAVFSCACALLVATGCATTRLTNRLLGEQQWRALCRRMPQRQVPSAGDMRAPLDLSAEQEFVLGRTAGAASESIVYVRTVTRGRRVKNKVLHGARETSSSSGGTGIVISPDGYILTNEHVVRNARRITIVFHDGAAYPVEAIVVHPRLDLALLRINRTDVPPALPSLEPVKAGTPVVAISYTNARGEISYRSGVVTSERKSLQRELDPAGWKDYGALVESTVQLEPGFSGGPLLDANGRLVGINVAVAGPVGTNRFRGYAIPLDARHRKVIETLFAAAANEAGGKTIASQLRVGSRLRKPGTQCVSPMPARQTSAPTEHNGHSDTWDASRLGHLQVRRTRSPQPAPTRN